MPAPVKNTENEDLGGGCLKEDAVREAAQDNSAHFTVDFRKSQRPRGYRRHRLSDLVDKFLPQASSLVLVPISRCKEFRLGLQPDDYTGAHRRSRSLFSTSCQERALSGLA
jgi:hypothetical protein